MRKGRVKKYMLWLMLMVVGLAMPVMMLLFFGSEITDDYNHAEVYCFRMSLSSAILALTTSVGLLIASPWTKIPGWIVIMFVYALVGYFIALLSAVYIDPESVTFRSYLAIYGIAIVVFFLNVALVASVQTWILYETLQLDTLAGFPVHGIFAFWTYLVFLHSYNTALVVISSLIVLAAVPVAMLVEVVLEKRALALVKRIGKIYL